MAFGDVGGAVTELVITCLTPAEGTVCIEKGEPVMLIGNYVVTNRFSGVKPIFGESMSAESKNAATIPIKVRGICIFKYVGSAPECNVAWGVTSCRQPEHKGKVKTGNWITGGTGIVLMVDEERKEVHVLL